jgi:flavin-dependent dehydrogenase
MCARVAIVGAGPAGCAAALTLRRYLPEISVLLTSMQMPAPSRTPAVGESLSPGVLPLLDYLGIRQEFLCLGQLSSWSAASAWGTEQVFEREYLFAGSGSGWHVDRSQFDAWLVGLAERSGARYIQARAKRATYVHKRWLIELDDGDGIEADAIVDATGRTSWLARSRGAVPRRDDALVAEARWYTFDESASNISGTLVETVEHGWWYSSTLPEKRAVAMFMTDSDLRNKAAWEERLALAPATGARLASWHETGEAVMRAANSQKSVMVIGKGWVSAGDAAAAFDPVSSLGIGFSLRSGTEAARVAVAAAEKDDGLAAAYAASINGIYADYRRRLRRIYWAERRWPTSPFWARRHSTDEGAPAGHVECEQPKLGSEEQ